MASKKKRLIILSIDKRVNDYLRTIISRVIGDEVAVDGHTIEATHRTASRPDAVLVSGRFLLPDAESRFPGVPVVAPVRIITGHNLEKVILLPKGQKALVVANHRDVAEGTIRSLIDLGIHHVNYVPYWIGREIDLSTVNAAITPGMTYLCPKEVEPIIDLGPRLISVHSFLNLLLTLQLDPRYVEVYSTYYHRQLTASTWELSKVLEQSEMLRKHEEVILNEFEDGVLSVDHSGVVDLANAAALKLFAAGTSAILGRSFESLVRDFEKLADLTENAGPEEKSTAVFTFKGKKILRTRIPVSGSQQKSQIFTFREIGEIQQLEEDVRRKLSRQGYLTKYTFADIWAQSEKVRELIDKARRFSKTGKNILITGESGTGKELFAHAIHASSPRQNGPFVAVNFAGLPEGLIESELFGYEDGAFTGARRGGKKGYFEQARGGTVFLDEIGDAPMSVQSRLLRVLQEKEVMRVGGSKIIPVEVRIIAATNTDLSEAIAAKQFRKDLYYRLNTLPIHISPLRDRPEDIFYLIERYLKTTYNIEKQFTPAAHDHILNYRWPGNVRELINMLEYICYASRDNRTVDLPDLPRSLRSVRKSAQAAVEEHTEFNCLANELSDHRLSLDTVRCCLEILLIQSGRVWGRNSLRRELEKHAGLVSEGRMKRWLTVLRDMGLVDIGATKQGTVITAHGEACYRFLAQRPTGRQAGSVFGVMATKDGYFGSTGPAHGPPYNRKGA